MLRNDDFILTQKNHQIGRWFFCVSLD